MIACSLMPMNRTDRLGSISSGMPGLLQADDALVVLAGTHGDDRAWYAASVTGILLHG